MAATTIGSSKIFPYEPTPRFVVMTMELRAPLSKPQAAFGFTLEPIRFMLARPEQWGF